MNKSASAENISGICFSAQDRKQSTAVGQAARVPTPWLEASKTCASPFARYTVHTGDYQHGKHHESTDNVAKSCTSKTAREQGERHHKHRREEDKREDPDS